MRIGMSVAAALLGVVSTSATALEYPLGQPVIKNGMEIQGCICSRLPWQWKANMKCTIWRRISQTSTEADIHAVEENPNGFAEGDWIPYLKVDYKVTKLDDPKKPSPAPLWRWLPATARTTVKT